MKIKLTALSAVLLALGSSAIDARNTNGGGAVSTATVTLPLLNNSAYGGKIFYVDPTNLHGYVYYPTALAAGPFANATTLSWGNANSSVGATVGGVTPTNVSGDYPAIPGAQNRGFGGGQANTQAILTVGQFGAISSVPAYEAYLASVVSADAAGGTCTSSSTSGSGITFAQTANTDQCLGGYWLGNIEETVQALYNDCYYNNGASSGLPAAGTVYWTSNVDTSTGTANVSYPNAYAVTYTSCTAGTTYGTPVITVDTAIQSTATYRGVAIRGF